MLTPSRWKVGLSVADYVDDHLREAAANRADVLLVDPEQLYA
jgi:hypothetical protein